MIGGELAHAQLPCATGEWLAGLTAATRVLQPADVVIERGGIGAPGVTQYGETVEGIGRVGREQTFGLLKTGGAAGKASFGLRPVADRLALARVLERIRRYSCRSECRP